MPLTESHEELLEPMTERNNLQVILNRSEEARNFAHYFISEARNVFQIGDPFISDTMHKAVRETFKMLAQWHPRNAARIIDLALAGAEDADQALRELIAEHQASGLPLDSALGTYSNIINERIIAHRMPMGRPRENFLANFVIIVLLIELQRRYSLPLRQSSTSRRPSASSIVSEVLTEQGASRGSEEAIKKIWRTYGPPVVPGWR
jgi:hypothetical protein